MELNWSKAIAEVPDQGFTFCIVIFQMHIQYEI